MNSKIATAIFHVDLAAAGEGAPEWVQLMPRGPQVVARDGRRFSYDPSVLVAAFKENRGPLPIDYEHAQDHLAPTGGKAPAAGWIVELAERAGELWGRVEWVADAVRAIAAREYRFLSPSMRHKGDNVITRLAGAGLVNRPAFEMTALSREETQPKETDAMSLKAIAKALGLADTADEQAVLAAIAERDNQRIALCKALELPETTELAAVVAKVGEQGKELKTALAAAETGETALAQQLTDTQTALASLQAERLNEKIDAALDREIAAGKITPASRESYRAMCAQEGGLERFTALAATLPVICEPTGLDGKPVKETTVSDDRNPVALAARATKYQKEQAEAGRVISIDVAVTEVAAQQEAGN